MEKYYFDEVLQEFCGEKVKSIVEDHQDIYAGFVDRFFTRYYNNSLSTAEENQDHSIFYHSNRICLISLAKSHIALTKGIKSISYLIGNVDRSDTKIKGKGKKGALNLQPTTTIALITCVDESQYKICSGIYGKLLEVNERLINHPTNIKIDGAGYVAVVLPKKDYVDTMKTQLLTQGQYDNTLKE